MTLCLRVKQGHALKSILQIFGKRYAMTLLRQAYGKILTFTGQKYDYKIILMSYDK